MVEEVDGILNGIKLGLFVLFSDTIELRVDPGRMEMSVGVSDTLRKGSVPISEGLCRTFLILSSLELISFGIFNKGESVVEL